MRFLTDFVRWFFYITTAILIICAINFGISDKALISKDTLWQILLSGFLTAAITVLLYPQENCKPGWFLPRCLVHYGALCAVMIMSGHQFGWLDYDAAGVVMMLVSVAVVYLICLSLHYLLDRSCADKINRKLLEKYGE